MRKDCDRKLENVFLKRDSLQVCLDATASKLSDVCISLTSACEWPEQNSGRSAGNHSWLESFITFSVLRLADGGTHSEAPKLLLIVRGKNV